LCPIKRGYIGLFGAKNSDIAMARAEGRTNYAVFFEKGGLVTMNFEMLTLRKIIVRSVVLKLERPVVARNTEGRTSPGNVGRLVKA